MKKKVLKKWNFKIKYRNIAKIPTIKEKRKRVTEIYLKYFFNNKIYLI